MKTPINSVDYATLVSTAIANIAGLIDLWERGQQNVDGLRFDNRDPWKVLYEAEKALRHALEDVVDARINYIRSTGDSAKLDSDQAAILDGMIERYGDAWEDYADVLPA